ncbi:BatA domain-containing protein [Aeoliella mucimassa]|uniref:Uncharacterized protein n=1 Tax=Aeoliella mucimassa TaxID=2527972 RepID=A0A518AIH5_9BACT|nr:BatA domain-containing protein [Aeoliella mucimassa]QDU54533.1 hypothetical protein Pan181_07150 [Aeoliella mucimassa]
MSFLAPTLLAGAALIALPVILHLVMRREPKRVEFPALRFVRKRQSTNQTRLQLRHWILLALRCAFIVLLALALSRPVWRGTGLSAAGSEGLAAAVVMDNSPRMSYLSDNQTRLDKAKETAAWLIEQLPADSELAVVEPGRSRRAKLGDRDSALLRVERAKIATSAPSLADAVNEAIRLVAERENHRREIYVFTDLAEAAWNDAAVTQLVAALDEHPATKLYLVDVGESKSINAGLGELELSAEHLATGESVTLRTYVTSTAEVAGTSRRVELWLDEPGKKPTKRGDASVTLSTSNEAVEFPLAGLAGGVHQGYVRLSGDDPLTIDNTRYFTVEVEAPPQLLLVGIDEAATRLMSEALAPSVLAQTAAARFGCDRISYNQLPATNMASYDAVLLLDPPPLHDDSWRKLSDFVQSGGGLAVYLGRHSVGQLEAFNTPASKLLLPAELRWVTTSSTYLSPNNYNHPVLKQLADIGAATPWPAFPVFKFWSIGIPDPAANVVATYAEGSPAIVEGFLGAGRVLLFTTTGADRASDDPWNLLPTNPDPWPFLALTEGTADYLVGADTQPLNNLAGRVMTLPLPRRSDLATFVLRPPTGDPLPQSLSPGQQEIVVTTTSEIGNYRVQSGGSQARFDRGFSINTADSVGRLQRADATQLVAALGKDRAELVEGHSNLARSIDLGSVGRELFGWLIALVALALGAEQFLADRFYARQ